MWMKWAYIMNEKILVSFFSYFFQFVVAIAYSLLFFMQGVLAFKRVLGNKLWPLISLRIANQSYLKYVKYDSIRTTIRHYRRALMHILLLIVGQTYKVAFSNPITPYMKKRREQLGVLNHKLQFVCGPTSIPTLLPWRLTSFPVFLLIWQFHLPISMS